MIYEENTGDDRDDLRNVKAVRYYNHYYYSQPGQPVSQCRLVQVNLCPQSLTYISQIATV